MARTSRSTESLDLPYFFLIYFVFFSSSSLRFFFSLYWVTLWQMHLSRVIFLMRWSLDEVHGETELERRLKQLLVFANVGGFFLLFSIEWEPCATQRRTNILLWDECGVARENWKWIKCKEMKRQNFAHLREYREALFSFLAVYAA